MGDLRSQWHCSGRGGRRESRDVGSGGSLPLAPSQQLCPSPHPWVSSLAALIAVWSGEINTSPAEYPGISLSGLPGTSSSFAPLWGMNRWIRKRIERAGHSIALQSANPEPLRVRGSAFVASTGRRGSSPEADRKAQLGWNPEREECK